VTSRRRCLIAALFGADELKTYPVDRDEATITAMRERAAKFWSDHVISGVPPAPVQLSDLDILHPKESDAAALLADDELTAKVLRLRAIDKEIKARTAEYEALEFDVKRAMGPCSEVVVGDTSAITWKARPHTYLDQAALKEAHPKIAKEFTRKGETRVFTLKQFGWKV
jgi:predicted phage-related endonuclease